MPTPTNGVPLTIEAGNSYAFLVSYGDFPVGSFTLDFCLASGNDAPRIVTATTSGNQFLVTLTPAMTENLPAGPADFACYAKATGVRYSAESGTIAITHSLARAKPKTFAEAQLEHWRAEYAELNRQKQFAMPQLQSTHYDPVKIREEIQHWEAVVSMENRRSEIARDSDRKLFGYVY